MTENIYEVPESELGATEESNKKPKMVWVIFVLSLLGLFGIPMHFVMFSGIVPLDASMTDYYSNMSVWDNCIVIFGSVYSFFAALQLFKLKKVAFKLYLGLIPISILNIIYSLNNENYLRFLENQDTDIVTSLITGGIFSILFIVYVFYLDRKGVLS